MVLYRLNITAIQGFANGTTTCHPPVTLVTLKKVTMFAM